MQKTISKAELRIVDIYRRRDICHSTDEKHGAEEGRKEKINKRRLDQILKIKEMRGKIARNSANVL